MQWSAIGFWAVLTEVLAHFLSLAWGFGMLVVAFVWLAGVLRTASVKAQSTEARVNALIPTVKTAYATANAALPASGGTVSGNLTVTGNIQCSGFINGGGGGAIENTGGMHINSNGITVDNLANVGSLEVNGQTMTFPVSRAGGLATAPTSYTQSWGNSVVSFCTQVNNQLGAAGIFV